MKPNWKRHGTSAGPMRNRAMIDTHAPALVIAFWDGVSLGTNHTIAHARKKGVKVHVVTCV